MTDQAGAGSGSGAGPAVLQMQFLINEGALVTATADDSIHLWNIRQKKPEIVHSLKFQRERLVATPRALVTPPPRTPLIFSKHRMRSIKSSYSADSAPTMGPWRWATPAPSTGGRANSLVNSIHLKSDGLA